MFDLMQYALIFYDFQLILAQMAPLPPSNLRAADSESDDGLVVPLHNRSSPHSAPMRTGI